MSMAARRSAVILTLCLMVSIESVSGQGCGVYTLSCSDCVSSPLGCAWCADDEFVGTRCFPRDQGDTVNCSSLQRPEESTTVTMTMPLSSTVQIQPQRITANLRAGVPETINFNARLAPNFPLDVYFLMDFSASMADDLEDFGTIAEEVATTVRNITNNFRLGFGSFVEKPTHPFVQIGPQRTPATSNPSEFPQTNQCILSGTCVAPYVFRNHLSLTSDSDAFRDTINNAIASTNFDRPEALLDAMVQVLACRNVIGWRDPPVRHMLIVITDDAFHVAGDGKLGAIVQRNLGMCLMENNQTYNGTDALRIDYPSVGLVGRLLLQENVIPIFMITQNDQVTGTYNRLVFDALQEVRGNVTFLTRGGLGVNQAIEQAYDTISARVVFAAERNFEGLQVSIVTTCTGATQGDTPNSCIDVAVDVDFSFSVMLNVTQCTEELRNGVNLVISDRFAGSVTISVTGLCGCDCESSAVNNSASCSGVGTQVCGVCQCNPNTNRFGQMCQCIDEDPSDGVPLTDICPVGTNGMQCSGTVAGTCNCGMCMCNEYLNGTDANARVIGNYSNGPLMACDCNDVDCEPFNGMTCNGRGTCECLECQCTEGYSGSACQCPPPDQVCIMPGGENQTCSGNGQCECMSCGCNAGYNGRYCQDCNSLDTCTDDDCIIYTNCVSCAFQIVNNGLQQGDIASCRECDGIQVVQVGNRGEIVEPVRACTAALSCNVDYYFALDQTDRVIYVVTTLQNCFIFPPWAIAVVIFIALLILAVLAILLVKLLLYVLDRLEYKRFLKEVGTTQFGENVNPLYHQPETQHANPLFAGKAPSPAVNVATEDDLPKKML